MGARLHGRLHGAARMALGRERHRDDRQRAERRHDADDGMEDKEAEEMLASYGLKEPGLNRLIRATYDLMGLTSFFTAGEPEVRAWTIHKNTNAVKAAGAIHSDIEKGFIRAEVVRWNDLLAAGSLAAAREKAQVRLEGKEYIVQEGDVILFRHSG